MLDLWQNNAGVSSKPQPGEANDLPAGFGDTFDAAWHEGRLFGSSVAQGNAQMSALEGYIGDVKQASGQDITKDVYSRIDLQQAAQDAVAKIKKDRPDLQIPDLTDDELDKRTTAVAAQAHQGYEAMASREKTFGGKVGGMLGSLAAGATDPLNLVGLAVAPEADLGIIGSAALWGGYGAVTQAASEVANGSFREQVQPGYLENGTPATNILESGVGGAVLGGGFKALGNAWTRMKTGEWPRTVRDAGNVVEGEANTQASNVLPGAEGEAAHREALGSAIDDILSGKPVGVETPPIDAQVEAAMAKRGEAATATEAAKASRGEPTGELPFEATAQEAAAEQATGSLADHVAGMGVPAEDAPALAQRVLAAKSDDEARAILNETMARPNTIADTAPNATAIAKAETPPAEVPPSISPDDRAAIFADDKHVTALNTELERLRDTGQGGMIPMGVDEKGEPKFQLLDQAIQDAHNDRDAAEQLEACINPPAEEAAE